MQSKQLNFVTGAVKRCVDVLLCFLDMDVACQVLIGLSTHVEKKALSVAAQRHSWKREIEGAILGCIFAFNDSLQANKVGI
jgi:hypothetical protein